MKVSRVIWFVAAVMFAKSVCGQGSIVSQTILSSPAERVSTMPSSKPTTKGADSVFTVMVFNFKQVSNDILSNAEKQADQIFDHAGIKIVWQECPTGLEPCHIGPGPAFFL